MLSAFLHKLETQANTIEFKEVIELIDENYNFNETEFRNGELINQAGQNNGSCKIFAFAQLHGLDQAKTLALFGHYYREHVLLHPLADDHQNIRNFIKFGWPGIQFEQPALTAKI